MKKAFGSIVEWIKMNRMCLNPIKTLLLLLTPRVKLNMRDNVYLEVGGTRIKANSEVNILGGHLNQDGKSSMIVRDEDVSKQVNIRLNCLKKNGDKKLKKSVAAAIIQSKFQYLMP